MVGSYNKLAFCWVCCVEPGVDPRLPNNDDPVVPVAVEGAGVDPNSPELGAVGAAGAEVCPNSPKLGAVDVAGAGFDPNRPEPGVEVVAPAAGVVPKIPAVDGALVAAAPNIPPVGGAEAVEVAASVLPPKIPPPVPVLPAAGPVGAVLKILLLGWVDVVGVLKRLLVFGVMPRLNIVLPEVAPVPACWVGVPLQIC